MPRADVLLVGPELEENLALRYLTASARAAGFHAETAPFSGDDDLEPVVRRAHALDPRVIGLSMTFQAGAPAFLRLARRLRRDGFTGHLTAGGQFATVYARRLLELAPELDTVVRGEAEDTLPQLLDAVRRGRSPRRVAGVSYRRANGARPATVVETAARPAETNLDRLPHPVRTPPFATQAGLPVASMLAGRGCRQGCTYCSIQTFGRQRPGPPQRFRSVRDVAMEMSALYREHGVRIFVFHDDNFLGATPGEAFARAAEFRDATAAAGLDRAALVIKIRPDVVTDDLVWVLREAGLVRAYVGVESGNPHGLKVLGRGLPLQANHRALEVFTRIGVFACYNLLAFHPEARLAEVREDVAFARAHPEVLFNVGRVEIYAGTPLERLLTRGRRLFGPELARTYRTAEPAAETAARIVSLIFRRRAFHVEGLLNAASSLGYEPAALARARPGLNLTALQYRVARFHRELVKDTCDRLEAACALAEASERTAPKRTAEAAAGLAWETARRDLELERTLRELRGRVAAAARTPAPANGLATHPRYTHEAAPAAKGSHR